MKLAPVRREKVHDIKEYINQKHNTPIVKPQDGFGNKYGYATHYLMLQMSAKQGLKQFGTRAVNAIKAEFHQLVHTMKVFAPQYFYKLTFDQKSKALKAITLIDFKRSGKVKGTMKHGLSYWSTFCAYA